MARGDAGLRPSAGARRGRRPAAQSPPRVALAVNPLSDQPSLATPPEVPGQRTSPGEAR